MAQGEPWAESYRLWRVRGDEPAPWRSDPRLMQGFTAEGYPHDLLVGFMNPDSATGGQHEAMWVSVIGYDRRTDHFLGILINQPRFLRNVRVGDNVTFAWNPKGWPEAIITAEGSYASGWPRSVLRTAFDSTLREGIRQYRAGSNGQNVPELDACIRTLTPLADGTTTLPSGDAAFLVHFVLARCLAETYATIRSLDHFRRAAALGPDSLDAQMGALAELSVLVHTPDSLRTAGTRAEWDVAFADQLALVLRQFGRNPDVVRILSFIMNPRSPADTIGLSAEERARRSRVGFAVMRWKQR